MATAAEIRNKAAKKLGLYGTGQTLQSAISADLDEAYDEVFDELKSLGLVTWAESAEVPDELVWPVVALTAFARVNEYAVPPGKYQRVVADAAIAERRIRQIQAKPRRIQTKMVSF